MLLQGGGTQLPVQKNNPTEPGSGLLSRWLSSHYHGGVHDEKSVARHTVNLLTSTIKVDADQSDLRFCFRIISPTKNYTLQVYVKGQLYLIKMLVLSMLAQLLDFDILIQYCVGGLINISRDF